MARLLEAPGLRVTGNRFHLAATLRPELDRGRIRFIGVIFVGSLFFLCRIAFEVMRTDAAPAEGIGWPDVLVLALASVMLGRALVREIGREVTLELSPHVLRYRVSVFGFGEFHDYDLGKVRGIRFVQGIWNSEGPPSALAFYYGRSSDLVRICGGLEDSDLYRLLDQIRLFRPDLCEPSDVKPEDAVLVRSTLGLS